MPEEDPAKGPTIALGRSWQRRSLHDRLLACWEARQGERREARQGRSTQRTRALEGPGTPHAHVLGGCLHPPRFPEALPPGTRTQEIHTPAKPNGPSMARSATRGSPSERKEVRPLRAAPTNPTRPGTCSRTPGIRSWDGSLLPAPVPGLERPGTLSCRPGSDYVGRAPGALPTPHNGGRHWARYVSSVLTVA